MAVALTAVAGGAAVAVQGADARTARPASTMAVVKLASVKVAVGSTNKTHTVLVNAKGRPVYMLTDDSSTHPLCNNSACLSIWPAVTTTSSKPVVGPGIKGKVGVWHHNKINQLTLNGHPLYTYAQDSKDMALGQGIKAGKSTWELMTGSGSGMIAAKSSGTSGGGSGW
jgi:predicted lipoprotein with Yx(FWY)xxD motif